MYRIYLVEDNENLNWLLKLHLERKGWQVSSFLTGKEAQRAIGDCPHLWILDIMLPDIDGYQLIKEIKFANPEIPVIFISARDADMDKITGLEMGSDDYLAKPFLPRELIIRTDKLLERIYGKNKSKAEIVELYSRYTISINKRIVTDKTTGKEIKLTSKEFKLLMYLINNMQQALSRDQIIENVWGNSYFGSDRVVDNMIVNLRKKMPLLNVETIYGYGYRMVKS